MKGEKTSGVLNEGPNKLRKKTPRAEKSEMTARPNAANLRKSHNRKYYRWGKGTETNKMATDAP